MFFKKLDVSEDVHLVSWKLSCNTPAAIVLSFTDGVSGQRGTLNKSTSCQLNSIKNPKSVKEVYVKELLDICKYKARIQSKTRPKVYRFGLGEKQKETKENKKQKKIRNKRNKRK